MPRINLVPGERQERAKVRGSVAPSVRRATWLPRSPMFLVGAVGMVALLVAVFVYFGEKRGLAQAEAMIVEAEADSARLQESVARVRMLEEVQARLASRVQVMAQVVEGRFYWVDLLETLSMVLPEHTWLEKIDQAQLSGDQIRIAGGTFTNAAVTDYMRGLEASPHLRDVALVGVSRVEKDDAVFQAFTLIATYEDFRATLITPPDTTETETRRPRR
jgi:Tfp pilus assembly protein PilN